MYRRLNLIKYDCLIRKQLSDFYKYFAMLAADLQDDMRQKEGGGTAAHEARGG
jgi:hypothetical protein